MLASATARARSGARTLAPTPVSAEKSAERRSNRFIAADDISSGARGVHLARAVEMLAHRHGGR